MTNTLIVDSSTGKMINSFSHNTYQEDLFSVLERVDKVHIPYSIRLQGTCLGTITGHDLNDLKGVGVRINIGV